jgi:CDP-diacylglycerol--glycerol-3-phosphate 3-phosphatidyltransferase
VRPLVNLANALTLSRFVLAPVMLWLLTRLQAPAEAGFAAWVAPAAAAVLLVALLTDMFDGVAARNLKHVTDFGKIMDPVADSTFFMTVLFALSASERIDLPIWMPLLVLYREVAMHVLRRYAALRGVVLAAKKSGKAKMATQSIAILAALLVLSASDLGLLRLGESSLGKIFFGVGLLVVAANLLSLPEYLRDVPRLLREERRDEPEA